MKAKIILVYLILVGCSNKEHIKPMTYAQVLEHKAKCEAKELEAWVDKDAEGRPIKGFCKDEAGLRYEVD